MDIHDLLPFDLHDVAGPHDATMSDLHGQVVSESHDDALGTTYLDAQGNVLAYEHPFGAVDNFIDAQGNELFSVEPTGGILDATGAQIGSLDTFGALHDSSGSIVVQPVPMGGATGLEDANGTLVAIVRQRFGG
jgi:hypothetical protein